MFHFNLSIVSFHDKLPVRPIAFTLKFCKMYNISLIAIEIYHRYDIQYQ